MSFLNPVFLLGLLAVGVPLLIYLWNIKKPKRVKFSTLTFFNSLKASSLRKIKLKRWLLLAIRTLAIVALAIALAKPFLPAGSGVMSEGEPTAIAIVIDNSPAMAQVDRNGPFIEQAVEIADEIISLKSRDDRVHVNVTHGPSMRSAMLSPAAASAELSVIDAVNMGNYLFENLQRAAETVRDAREPNKIVYLITDGRESSTDKFEEFERDEKLEELLQVIRVGDAEPANVGVEDVELISQNGEHTLRAMVRNYGSQSVEDQYVNFLMDDELIVQQPYRLDANSSEEFEFTLPSTDRTTVPVEIAIEGDELTYDNRFFAAVHQPERRNLLVVERDGDHAEGFRPYLRPLLDAAEEQHGTFDADYRLVSELSPDQFADYDAVVLNSLESIPDYLAQPLIDHVQAGAGLFLLPAADGDIQSYNRLLSLSEAGRYGDITGRYGSFSSIDRLATPEEGHPIFEALFDKQEDEEIRLNVPELFYYFQIEAGSPELTTPLLESRTGNIIMNEVRVGSGRMIYSAIGSDPGWSNFPIKPFFAPLYYRTVNYLIAGEGASIHTHTLGNEFNIQLQGVSAESVELEYDSERIIPDTRQTFSGLNIRYEGREWEPGWLTLHAGDEKRLIGVNQDAMESQLFSLNDRELQSRMESLFSDVRLLPSAENGRPAIAELETASFGKEIWHWFIIAAICLLLLETIISRLYKAETIS